MSVLKIFIEGDPFDRVSSGKKKIEYRAIKPFWTSRLYNNDGTKKDYKQIEFINGMRPDSRRMVVQFLGFYKKDGLYHIKLGKITKRNFKTK